MNKFICSALIFWLSMIGAEIQGSISVIIPCSYKHAHHLHSLLELYECQTLLPDEIIISLSEAHQVSPDVIPALKKTTWPFQVNIRMTNEKKYAGENRNRACQYAQGDIFVCQDADDIPHPQRIEIIHYFFKNYTINQLLHDWIGVSTQFMGTFETYDINKISYVLPTSYTHIWSFKVHFGNVAITKEVFNAVKWSSLPRGQDTVFNLKVYERFKKCMVVRVPLLVYRSGLSTLLIKKLLITRNKRRGTSRYAVRFIEESKGS